MMITREIWSHVVTFGCDGFYTLGQNVLTSSSGNIVYYTIIHPPRIENQSCKVAKL